VRSKSSKLCSPRHGTETNGVLEKKWPSKIRPVHEAQINARINNR